MHTPDLQERDTLGKTQSEKEKVMACRDMRDCDDQGGKSGGEYTANIFTGKGQTCADDDDSRSHTLYQYDTQCCHCTSSVFICQTTQC